VKLEQDSDVLDTWFSSGLWPFSTLGWPDPTAPDLKKFYPNSIMETGFDILFFWVARMVMMGLEFTGKVPFSKVYMHPMVRDEHGQKMSKTKGNVIDPLDIIKDYGADTLRLTLNALCVQGRDLRLSDERIESYKHFINKLWNFTKFALMGEEGAAAPDWRKRPTATLLHDRWILSRLDATARDVNKSWSEFRMLEATEKLYHFVWSDCCDWYLEAVKTSRTQSRAVLLHVLGETLKLMHPVCPHVTEELWHEMPGVGDDESLAIEPYPEGEAFSDAQALAEFRFVQDTVSALRTLRSESKVPPGKKFNVYVPDAGAASELVLTSNKNAILSLTRLEDLLLAPPPAGQTLTRVVVTAVEAGRNVEILIPLSELVDVEEERSRLKKEIENLSKVVKAQESKLSNDSFVSRAPKEVIDKERLKLDEARDKLVKTQEALVQIASQVSGG
jgi:valyl-tRNA synthetase